MKATTVLNGTLTASRARENANVKQLLTGILREAIVTVIQQYFYRVDFGPDVQPQHHTVSHDLVCTCSLGEDCPAVTAVKKYLKDGNPAAETPRPGYYPAVPAKCPVCGAACHYDPSHTSKVRGVGWECSKEKHYWQSMAAALKANFAAKPKSAYPIDPVSSVNNPFAFKDGYDPNREYPACPTCGRAA